MKRRKLLKSSAGLIASASLIGSATAEETDKNNQSVLEAVRKRRRSGKIDEALNLLDSERIPYGSTGTVGKIEAPEPPNIGIKQRNQQEKPVVSQAIHFGRGPFAQDKLHKKAKAKKKLNSTDGLVRPDDVYSDAHSEAGIMAYYTGKETHRGDTYEAYEGQSSIILRVKSNDFDIHSTKPPDILATTFEGSWWMVRDTNVRTGNPWNSPGEIKDIQTRSDGITAKIQEPSPGWSDTPFVAVLEFKLYMHPNAEGSGQLFGHHAHTYQTSWFGTLSSIAVGKGVLQVSMNMDGGRWILDTPGLLVNNTCDNRDPDWCTENSE